MSAAINIGLSESERQGVADSFSSLLADTFTLYLKTHNYHWNVEGPLFNTLHLMFEGHYTELATAVDEIAERIRALGVKAPGSYAAFADLASIREATGRVLAEPFAEELAQVNIFEAACAGLVRVPTRTAGRSATHRFERTAVAVVHLPLVRIVQDLVRLLDRLELGLRGIVVRVQVRVVFARQFPIRFLNLILGGVPMDSQSLVKIFGHGAYFTAERTYSSTGTQVSAVEQPGVLK